MNKSRLLCAFAVTVCMGVFSSCSDDDGHGGGGYGEGSYVLAAAAGEDAAYLVKSGSLDEGNVTVVGNGLEATSGSTWIYYRDQYLYNLQYNQGSAGVTESYVLDADGLLTKRPGTYNITRFTTYGILGENIITVSAVDTDEKDANNNPAKGLGFNFLHVTDETTSTKTIPCENFLGNGEYVTFAGVVEANGKIYTSVVPMGMSKYGVQYNDGERVTYPERIAQESGGTNSSAYEKGVIPVTQFPDQAFVAIYDNANFLNPVIVKTDKMGFASGRNKSQYYQTIWADDQGNIYVFSPGYGRKHTSSKYHTPGTCKASVMRIKKNDSEFDADYGVVDIEILAGGFSFLRCWHITGDYFLLQMYTTEISEKTLASTKLAIYKGSTKSLDYVTGLPDPDAISSFGGTPFCENGVAYMPVITNDGAQPALYKIDPVSRAATKGLTVTAESVSGVGKLEPRN